MKHRKSHRNLSRKTAERRSLFRTMVTNLLRDQHILTTEAKAKTIRPIAERIITLGRRGDLHARRRAAAYLTSKNVLKTLFEEIGPHYEDRNGGYTRIVKVAPRPGDAAPLAVIELVQ